MLDFPSSGLVAGVTTVTGPSGQVWLWDGTKWTAVGGGGGGPAVVPPVQISFVIPGKTPADQVYNVPIVFPLVINAAEFNASEGFASTAATGMFFTVSRMPSGENVGVITVIGSDFSFSYQGNPDGESFAVGEVLQMQTSGEADATLADVGISLLAKRA